MQYINIDEGKLHIVFGITDKDQIKLLHFSAAEFDESTLCKEPQFIDEMFQLVQINFSGYNRPYEKHGNKHIVTAPGYTLTYKDMQDTRNAVGRRLVITQTDKETGAYVVTTWQFYEGTQIVRMWNEVFNEGTETQTLEYLSSFYYAGIEKEGDGSTDEKLELRICHNGWQKEMNWKTYSFPDLGLGQTQPTVYQRTSKTIEVTNTGNWSTKEYLPMGYLANKEADSALYWQIEHNGSWHYEIGDQNRHFYKLDNVIEKTRASIEEYKKLKQAVITQAVTKGIRGNREMKDSGIDWIGEIPVEWEVSQIKYSLKWKSEKGQPQEEVLSLYRDYGIVPKDSRDDNHNVTSLDTSGYKVVDIGDFVINKMKAWQGSMAVSEYRGIISPAYHVCKFINDKLNKKYFHYLMRNKSYISEYTRLSTGMRVGQWDLGFDDFKNIPFLLPPQEEQQEIVDYLDKKCSAIDDLIAKKEQYLFEIENYKKSLIYEYVTGKKEVPVIK